MARLARIVAPGLAHHVTARGNRRQRIFLRAGDEAVYRAFLAAQLKRFGLACWAYCLMPNHVHLILVPQDEAGLARAVGEAHRRYTSFVNAREDWTGHLFQGRFHSVVMDEPHLMAAARYVAQNPVRAGLVRAAEDWPWSSARAHRAGRDDGLARVAPLLGRACDVADLLGEAEGDGAVFEALRRAEWTGRPLGSEAFVRALEAGLGRPLLPRRRGRKPLAAPAQPALL